MRKLTTILLASLLLSGTAEAQDDSDKPPPRQVVVTQGPVSLTVAMTGIVVVGAGFGMMLHANDCWCGKSDTGQLIGGVVIVAAGVTMVYLGLRSKTVIIVPTLSPQVVGARATIQWGGKTQGKHHDNR